MIARRYFLVFGLSVVAMTACSPKQPDATYYLVRHAEKTAEKPDPALTLAGQGRAESLADRLKNVPLKTVYSTDYKRTRDTGMPTAVAHDLDLTFYNPGALSELADDLLTREGAFLIVGHSNTTPVLAQSLGVDGGEPIVEATEYDRLYVIERTGESITGRIERYGN